MHKVLILSGATASGKSDVAIKLAQKFDGEIINADSMQVYRGLDIGTAKMPISQREGIKHHLFDFVHPDENFDIYQYQSLARQIIADIVSRNKVPILVGGSGLYIQSTVLDYRLISETIDYTIYEQISNETLYHKLQKLDVQAAKKIEKNNRRRLMRAVALAEQTEWTKYKRESEQGQKALYDILPLALMPLREELYGRINARAIQMLNNGLIAEVDYFQKHFQLTNQIKQAIGYKETLAYLLDQSMGLDVLLSNIQQNTRRLAKRQITWIKNQRLSYHYFDNEKQIDVMNQLISSFLTK